MILLRKKQHFCQDFIIQVLLMEKKSLKIFFFQAEDGIRDLYVTGVQTCALPIWYLESTQTMSATIPDTLKTTDPTSLEERLGALLVRSEERRVGKECSDSMSYNHLK